MQEKHSWQVYRKVRPASGSIVPANTPLWPGSPITPPGSAPFVGTQFSLNPQESLQSGYSKRNSERRPDA